MSRSPSSSRNPHRPVAVRWSRLARKELRETLRDRRTLVTLVLMPLLVYPLLSITFNRFLVTMRPTSRTSWLIAVQPPEATDQVQRLLEQGHRLVAARAKIRPKQQDSDKPPPPPPKVSLEPTNDAHVAVQQVRATIGIEVEPPANRFSPPTWRLIFRDGELSSAEAVVFVERRLAAVNEEVWRDRLAAAGLPDRAAVAGTRVALPRGRTASLSLAMLVPLILILMTITGAVYPAIDLTAGERERGTLEMLIASPVPSYQLLMAKYTAVVTVAVLTALINLTAMAVTLSLSGLGSVIFGDTGPSLVGVALVVALTFLFAAFFSAVLLAITSMARSFKEAQAYLIPVMLLAISPGMLTLMPQIRLNGWLSIIPLVNTALLAREALEGTAPLAWTLTVIGTTILYAVLALTIAARIFGSDAVGTVNHSQWKDLWQRPAQGRTAPALSHGFAGLTIVFLFYYLLGNIAIRLAGISVSRQLTANALVTLLVFLGLPWLLSWQRKIGIRSTFSLRWPPLAALIGGLLLGISLWPWAYELFRLAEWSGISPVGQSTLEHIRRLLKGLAEMPWWLIAVCLAVIPAIAEEWFFRGFVLSWLQVRVKQQWAIVGSALLFALFHVLSPTMLTPERFLPTAMLGLVLGWICVRTSSLLPGIALHLTHNAILPWIVLRREEIDWLWGGTSSSATPAIAPVWLAVTFTINAIGIVLILIWTWKRNGESTAEQPIGSAR